MSNCECAPLPFIQLVDGETKSGAVESLVGCGHPAITHFAFYLGHKPFHSTFSYESLSITVFTLKVGDLFTLYDWFDNELMTRLAWFPPLDLYSSSRLRWRKQM